MKSRLSLVINESATATLNTLVERDGKWYVYSEDGTKKLGESSRGGAGLWEDLLLNCD